MTASSEQQRQRRVGENEAAFRQINENIGAERDTTLADRRRLGFLCECGLASCQRLVDLTLVEYERVRSGARRFLILPEHDFPSSEDVVERHAGYWVVEKHEDAADIAEARDPRA